MCPLYLSFARLYCFHVNQPRDLKALSKISYPYSLSSQFIPNLFSVLVLRFCLSVLLLFCTLSQSPFPLVHQPSWTSTSACLPTPPFGLHLCAVQTQPLDFDYFLHCRLCLSLAGCYGLPLFDLARLTTKLLLKFLVWTLLGLTAVLHIGSIRKPDICVICYLVARQRTGKLAYLFCHTRV